MRIENKISWTEDGQGGYIGTIPGETRWSYHLEKMNVDIREEFLKCMRDPIIIGPPKPQDEWELVECFTGKRFSGLSYHKDTEEGKKVAEWENFRRETEEMFEECDENAEIINPGLVWRKQFLIDPVGSPPRPTDSCPANWIGYLPSDAPESVPPFNGRIPANCAFYVCINYGTDSYNLFADSHLGKFESFAGARLAAERMLAHGATVIPVTRVPSHDGMFESYGGEESWEI